MQLRYIRNCLEFDVKKKKAQIEEILAKNTLQKKKQQRRNVNTFNDQMIIIKFKNNLLIDTQVF